MRVALIFGAKGESVKTKLCSIKDNLDIDCFLSVPDFIDTALKRGTIYDRILILSNLTDDISAQDLWSYWGMTSKQTSVVMLGKKGKEEEKGRKFVDLFKVPNVSAMLVDNTTVQLVSEAVLLPNKDINEKYGITDIFSVEEAGGVVLDLGGKADEEPEQTVKEEVVDTASQTSTASEPSKTEKKQKRTLISALLGKSGKNKGQTQPAQEKIVEEPKVEEEIPKQEKPTREQAIADARRRRQERLAKKPLPQDEPQEVYEDSTDTTTEYEDFTPSFDNFSNVDYENDGSYDEFNNSNDSEAHDASSDSDEGYTFEPESVAEEQTPSRVSYDNIRNDFEPDEDYEYDEPKQTAHKPARNRFADSDVEEVAEDLGAIDLTAAEDSYRQQNEAPKVIIKEKEVIVEKEIIRNVGGDGTVKSILAGKNPSVVLVTGDRGTGVTSTCLSLLNFFKAKTRVLYVDLDTEFHGLLSYIDYLSFASYEPAKKKGLKLCSSFSSLPNCLCNLDTNFDVLTTDYDCTTTDSEIKESLEVVAEAIPSYGVILIDCPMSKLHLVSDLVLSSNIIVCAEASKRGLMNLLCALEDCKLQLKYKKLIANKGLMLLTKLHKDLDIKKLLKYITSVYEPDGVDWMSMRTAPFSGKVDIKFASSIFNR